jgi:hypothetical protein
VNVVSVEPANAPMPSGIVVAQAFGTDTSVIVITNTKDIQRDDVVIAVASSSANTMAILHDRTLFP